METRRVLATSGIHGYVFEDANGNGLDDTEPVVGGVEIQLYRDVDDDGSFDGPADTVQSATTDAQGIYSFVDLDAGSYRVTNAGAPNSQSANAHRVDVALREGDVVLAAEDLVELTPEQTEFIQPDLAFGYSEFGHPENDNTQEWTGIIPDGTVWESGEVHLLSGDITLLEDSVLTIEAGSIIKARTFVGLEILIAGTLVAQGTAEQPILFTSDLDDIGGDTNGDGKATAPTPGNWNRMQFTSTSADSVLDHVEFRYGGAGARAQVEVASSLSMANAELANSSSAGLRIESSSPTLRNISLADNLAAAISMDLASSPTIDGTMLQNNGANSLVLDSGVIDGDRSWNNPDIVYRLSGDILVPTGRTLTVEAGQVIKAQSAAGNDLIVDGGLIASGTEAEPIIITSDRDDTAGGDTNNDGNATSPAAGNWNSILLRQGGSNHTIDHVQIRYGGAGSPALLSTAAPLELTNSVLQNSLSAGLRIQSADALVTNTAFRGNRAAAISIDLHAQPDIHDVQLVNNGVNAVALDGGTLVSDQVWDNPEVVYRLGDDIIVSDETTLTISSGQVVKAQSLGGFDLLVDGALVASGSAESPIVFTSDADDSVGGDTNNDRTTTLPNAGNWNSIQLRSSTMESRLDHVSIRYGGAGSPALLQSRSPLDLTNSVIGNSSSAGLRMETSAPTIADVSFQDNHGPAMAMDLASNPSIDHVEFENNGRNGLALDAGSITSAILWDDPDVVYRLSGDVLVEEGASLSIAAGQVIKADAGTGTDLVVDGTLTASGTADSPIVFTSARDDTAGGDTNNDGNATGPKAGDWNSIQLHGNDSIHSLSHLDIRYGGSGSSAQLFSASPLSFSDSILQHSSSAAMRIEASNPSIGNVTFQDNLGAAISMDLTSDPQITAVTTRNNSVNGIALDSGELQSDAIWDDSAIVYRLSGDVIVPEGITLNVSGGQIVKSRTFGGADLIIEGTLIAAGSPTEKVVFTSDRDDSVGGDTNNDLTATSPEPGNWNSIQFRESSHDHLLDHVSIRYGGTNSLGNIWTRGGNLLLHNSEVRNSLNNGVTAEGDALIRITNNLIVDNSSAGVLANGSANITAINNTIDNNGKGIGATSPTASLTLANNLVTNNRQTGVFLEEAARLTLQYNNVFNPFAWSGNYTGLPDRTGIAGNISSPPVFVDLGGKNYRLAQGSPGVDAGTSDDAPVTDRLGNARVDDPAASNRGEGVPNFVDMGALERVPSGGLVAAIVPVDPNPRLDAVDEVAIVFTEAVTGFDLSDLTLRRESSANLLDNSSTLVSHDGRTWTLDNLNQSTAFSGSYTLTLRVDNSGIQSASGNVLSAGATSNWTNARMAGDANLDGSFNQADIVAILQTDKYIKSEPATWAEGDWTGDGLFNQFDIVVALQSGIYLRGPYFVADTSDRSTG